MTHASRTIATVVTLALTLTQFSHAAQTLTLITTVDEQEQEPTPPLVTQPPSPEALAQSRLLSAKNIYIANDGADSGFPADPGAGVAHLTASLRAWGRYNIVSTVQQADLVLQLRSATTASVIDGTDTTSASIYHSPFFRLSIADPVTLRPLWPITVPVRTGIRKKDKADLLDISAQNLTSQLKLLVGETLSARDVAKLQQSTAYANAHGGRTALFIVAGTLAAGGIAAFLLHKHYEDAVQKQQDDLCKQNVFFCTGH